MVYFAFSYHWEYYCCHSIFKTLSFMTLQIFLDFKCNFILCSKQKIFLRCTSLIVFTEQMFKLLKDRESVLKFFHIINRYPGGFGELNKQLFNTKVQTFHKHFIKNHSAGRLLLSLLQHFNYNMI